MTKPVAERLSHLSWAVESRARNQRSAVHLLRLLVEYEDKWRAKRWARAAQDLLAVSFSLWRAAFLAEKTSHRKDVLASAIEFLEKVIADNAISYAQDRKCNEWTFNYYTKNARSSLMTLAECWPEYVPKYEEKTRSPTVRWDYCQDLLDRALVAFEPALQRALEVATAPSVRKLTRQAAKRRRRASRAVTLSQKEKR